MSINTHSLSYSPDRTTNSETKNLKFLRFINLSLSYEKESDSYKNSKNQFRNWLLDQVRKMQLKIDISVVLIIGIKTKQIMISRDAFGFQRNY